jgi:hypothetical protein
MKTDCREKLILELTFTLLFAICSLSSLPLALLSDDDADDDDDNDDDDDDAATLHFFN